MEWVFINLGKLAFRSRRFTGRRYYYIIILALLTEPIYGQSFNRVSEKHNIDTLNTENKNNIYVAAGYYIIMFNATINYERMVFHLGRRKSTNLFLRAGYGKWVDWTSGGTGGILGANLIFFKGSSHLETGFGAIVLYDRKMYEDVLEHEPPASKKDFMIYNPCINLGYRYQKPGRHGVFRIGLSYPEGGYAALGVAF
jgi:hypothetical protein